MVIQAYNQVKRQGQKQKKPFSQLFFGVIRLSLESEQKRGSMMEAERECSFRIDGTRPISSINLHWQGILLSLTFYVLFKQKQIVSVQHVSVTLCASRYTQPCALSLAHYGLNSNFLLMDQLCFSIIKLLKPTEGVLISTQNSHKRNANSLIYNLLGK